MREKKNIDRLYQEKFKDFEAVPREAVWKSISAKLKEEDRKKTPIIPFWRRLAGVAAILSLLLMIGDWLLQPLSAPVVSNEEQVENEKENRILAPVREALAESPNREQAEPVIALDPKQKQKDREKQEADDPVRQEVLKTSSISIAKAKKSSSGLLPQHPALVDGQNDEKLQGNSRKRSIYEQLNKEFEEEKATTPMVLHRMEIKTQAAPIYYGNFGTGNFIDSRFNANSNEGEVTYSYGINIAYAISDKIKIRSGVNKVSMSYNTNNVAYNAVARTQAISNINYTSPAASVQVTENHVRKNTGQPVSSANRAPYSSFASGLLNQKTGFIEVPVEVEYNLLDRKFELNVIGGVSTLFLDENMVSINSGTLNTVLGEATNINQVSFSTNIGLGLDYNLSRRFKLNLEPIFKYQINTYNNPAGNFQPYYLGIYSGFSFQF